MNFTSEQAREMVENGVAFLQRSGLKAPIMEPGRVVLSMPLQGNVNHINMMYAGALFSVGEVTGGAIFLTSFDAEKYYPIIKDLYINFRRPATSDVSIEMRMTPEEIRRIEQEAAEKGKCDYILEGNIMDEKGEVVATMKGTYQMRAAGN